jgi:hypothetical protein
VDGKPLLVILDVALLTRQFRGPSGVNGALRTLRDAAREVGLPGVFVVGGIHVGRTFDWDWFDHISAVEAFDAFTQYAYPAAPGIRRGERSYREVIAAAEANWKGFAAGERPFIPDVMTGWDPRPWQEKIGGRLWWFRRSPAQVASLVRRAVRFVLTTPKMRLEPAPAPPVVLLEAWNELGEGAFLVPTVGSCHRYGKAIAAALAPPGG